MAQDAEEASARKKVRVTVASAAPAPKVRVGSAPLNVTLSDADVLDCSVCFLPLRPPIFQCEVGHVVCSACRDKMEATGNGRCHVCRVATRGGGYRRCHAMEQLVDSARVACPYAAHGCDATPPYHGRESHRQACPQAPCHCPGDSCGFIGSTAALLDHFAGTHGWPCTTTNVRAGEKFGISLHLGFNFVLLADDGGGGGEQAAATSTGSSGVTWLLFLLNVTQERLGRAISVLCIHPHANGAGQPLSTTPWQLAFSGGGSLYSEAYQTSEFRVTCSDLSNGLPSPDAYCHFILPNSLLGDSNCIQVRARCGSGHSVFCDYLLSMYTKPKRANRSSSKTRTNA